MAIVNDTELTNFYDNFLTTFLQTGNGLAINSMWLLFFNNIPDVTNINNVIQTYGANSENLSTTMTAAATISNNKKGLIIAQGVKINGENLNVDRKGFKNTGYIQGMIGNGREGFPTLDISILENNISFVDYFLRPWVVAVGHKSLKDQTLKSDITVWFLGKGGTTDNNPLLRKAITYKNCRPISINQQEYNYSGSDMVKERPVSFVYTHYEMSHPHENLLALIGKQSTGYNANILQRIITNLSGNVADALQTQINKVRKFVLTSEEVGVALFNRIEQNAINNISTNLSISKTNQKPILSNPSGTPTVINTDININSIDTPDKTLKVNQIHDPKNDVVTHTISPENRLINQNDTVITGQPLFSYSEILVGADDSVLATTPLKTYTEKVIESVDNVTINTVLKFNDYRTDTNDVPSSLTLMKDTKKPNASDTPDSKSITYTVKSINSGDTP